MPTRVQLPSTPVSNHTRAPFAYTPSQSSPLAPSSSPSRSSPISAAQARRQSQYKARTPSLPKRPMRAADFAPGVQLSGAGNDSQAAFLRTRLHLRCIERASKARERAVRKKRSIGNGGEPSSDDIDMGSMEDEDDAEDGDPLHDELFVRIMRNATRRLNHSFMYSYDREIGSFDPALDEPREWEAELAAQVNPDESTTLAQGLEDDAELQAYLEAEEAFDAFADIPADELFDSGTDLFGDSDMDIN
ncbi:hypothetical protein GGX14DRAFT_407770 [Mycena pura]|uniref:Uncharacterized protein n=1 Tax=Mycena pura TaxID=153505 RepID=A0AAD6UMD6_9AGAR|nr:hypothetical protein GGX14DRAFT_407770 [Mycena pura]